MQFSLTNTGITILFVYGFTHGRGYSLLTEESIADKLLIFATDLHKKQMPLFPCLHMK